MNVKKRNNSIDLFRYVCAVLVVIIHTEPFYTGEWAGLGIFLKEFLARIAVPFFFAVSGYFLFLKIDQDGKAPFRSAWRLTKVYLFWSIPYLLLNLWVLRKDIPAFFGRTVTDLFIHGTSSHFWFFPALIYATLIVAFIYKTVGWKPLAVAAVVLYIVGVVGSSYTPLGMQIPGLSALYGWEQFAAVRRIFMTAIPFVTLGGWIARRDRDVVVSYRHNQSYDWLVLAAAVVAYVLEKCVLLWIDYPINGVNTLFLFPLTAVILMLLLKHPSEKHTGLAPYARTCANFIYYMHILCILVVERCIAAVFHCSLQGIWVFVITVTVLTAMGVVLHRIKWVRKLLN